MARIAGACLAAVLALTLLMIGAGAAGAVPPATAPVDPRPSVLLVVTDDQRWDTLWSMPSVQHRLVERGVQFTNGFVSNPLCCPSRTSILTGNYSHTTGVYRQIPPWGAFPSFRDESTLATWLDDAGYTTGLFGKYVDVYQSSAMRGYVPPGWDRWRAFVHSEYYDYGLSFDGEIRLFGNDPLEYSTDVLGDEAVRFIEETEGPIFVEFAPAAPHAPAIPAERHRGTFEDLPRWRPPSYDEVDVTDKPAYVRRIRPMSQAKRNYLDWLRPNQYRSLQAVDEQVDRLLDALRRTGRLDSTLVVFTSDNGLSWGEHRWGKKETPYEESIRVPLVVRYDPLALDPRQDAALALNIDIAPTIADVTGVGAPDTEGRSLLPRLVSPDGAWRHDFLIEHMEGANPVPTYCGVRTETAKYVLYRSGEEELYDLASDPFELANRIGDPELGPVRDHLRERLAILCDPAPPGMKRTSQRLWLGLASVALLLLAGWRPYRARHARRLAVRSARRGPPDEED